MAAESSVTIRDAARLADSALEPAMLDMGKIATALGVTKRTVQSWRESGLLPPPDFEPVRQLVTLDLF